MPSAGIGDDPWLVFERNVGRGLVGDDRGSFSLPGLAPIERAANKNSVPCCPVRPVIGGPKLVEGDIAEQRVSRAIIGNRNVAGDLVILWSCSLRDRPALARVGGI